MTSEAQLSALLAENERLRQELAEERRRHAHAREDIGTNSRYRSIVESAVDYGIIATDLEGIVTDWNEAVQTITGWSAEQTIGRSIATIFTPEDVENEVHLREMRFALTMGKALDERWHLRADGERFFASGQMTPLHGDDGNAIGFLKILRDRTAEEKNRRDLEANRERLQFALDASDLIGTWDWHVEADVVYADRHFASLYGIDADRAAAGVSFSAYVEGIHPEDRERVAARVTEAIETGGTFSEEYRTIDLAGRLHFVFARGCCFKDAEGRPDRFPGAIVDVTDERRREARQRALLRIDDDMSILGGSVDHTRRVIEVIGETLDLDRVGYASVDEAESAATIVSEWTRPGVASLSGSFDMSHHGDGFMDGLRSGSLIVEDVASDPATASGAERWARLGIAAVVNMTVVENGRVRMILYLHHGTARAWEAEDITFVRDVLNRAWAFGQRRRAEQALIEAETRLRLAHEAAEIGTFDYDLKTGILLWDARCRAAFGIFDDRPVDYESAFLPGLHPDDRAETNRLVAEALDPAGDGRFDTNYRTIGREDGTIRWIHASGQTVVEDGETVRFVGAVRDVSEEKEGEERQQMLTRELQHRVKNTLAMVNALANQTLRRATNVQDGLAAFSARLIALSHAHDILTQTSWTSAPIGAIVAQSLETHRTDDAERFVWSGPDIRLNAKQSLALALALHELATNAAKYGALSGDDGQVTIDWRIEPGHTPRFVFEWRETGGPAVSAPNTRGFGSRLIEQSLALEFGGSVSIDYRLTGVVCRIEAPLHEEGGEAAVG